MSPVAQAAPTDNNDCPWVGSSAPPDERAQAVLAKMTTEEKVATLSLNGSPDGYQNYFPAIPRLCVPRLLLQDGPAGVAAGFTGVTQLPAPLGLAATWDRSLAEGYGGVQATESWGKGIHVAQGPNLNIARVPQGGRDFESYGEDPYLSGQMGVANITGIQDKGVMSNVKHYFANNQETERESINEHIDERTQREIYMPQFETAVKDGNAASMMCAYNQINDVYSCQNHAILTDVLKGEWGYRGFVRSDWGAAHNTADAYNAGMDLAKPGRADLAAAVDSGAIPMSRIDDAVTRVLRRMFEYGLFERQPTGTKDSVVTTPEHAARARDIAAQGTVLLKNKAGVLPLDNTKVNSIAVLGNNAAEGVYTGGGGSSSVVAPYVVSPLTGITDRAGKGVTINRAEGQPDGSGALPPVASQYLTPPSGTGNGLEASYYNNTDLSGKPVLTRVDPNIDFDWDGAPGPGVKANNFSVRWTGSITPPTSTKYTFSLLSLDGSRLYVDDKLVVDNWNDGRTCCHKLPDAKWGSVDLAGGQQHSIKVEYFHKSGDRPVHLGWADVAQMREDAAAAAAKSNVAVVVVNDRRTESMDRPNLQLPYEQDKLIEAVAAANPLTVVVLNTGGPALMPWADKVSGIVEAWYPGQEDGNALASVLFGDVNPSGKLPMTFPSDESKTPVSSPQRWPGVDGQAHYSEGLQVGYRWYDANDVQPLFAFGHGLSYTQFAFSDLSVTPEAMVNTSFGAGAAGQPGNPVKVTATVTNTGSRAGSDVAQLYLSYPGSAGEPPRQLRGFQKVSLEPGQSKTVEFTLDGRDLAYWKTDAKAWVMPSGTFQVHVGDSSAVAGLPLHGQFQVVKSAGNHRASLDAPATLAPGSPTTVTGTFVNDGDFPVGDVDYQLQVPQGWQVKPVGTQPSEVDAHGSAKLSWQVTPPYAAQGTQHSLTLQVGYGTAGGEASVKSAASNVGVSQIAEFAFTPAQVVLDSSGNASATLKITNKVASPVTVDWQATPPPGLTLSPSSGTVTIAPGASSSVAVGVSSDGSAGTGSRTVEVSGTAKIDAGTYDLAGSQVGVVVPYSSLVAAFNNNGITSTANPGVGDISGSGITYNEDALADVGLTPGGTFTSDGITYTWPDVPADQLDNVAAAGQTVPVSGSGTKLGFVGSSTYGSGTGTGTVHFTDGSTQEFTLTLSDYYNPEPIAGNTVVANAAYRNGPNGINNHTATVFSAYVELTPGKTAAYVTLPDINSGNVATNVVTMHIFAVAVGG
ncbi:glycoside hydrolase family 3 C-terminal domain-containing protein [Actinophytocola sp.]|uniref:glycoside hydrolase family 3 C-terminal domain-containing protein n=1 Tax=Actinophytocola sp. TaxID=1872138 RepID=UPI0025BF1CD8|nr:glycoside hydrolase family 3 C-terminal domain-containing protein [Actinophytocola sp.]